MPDQLLIEGIQTELNTLVLAMKTLGRVFSVACMSFSQFLHLLITLSLASLAQDADKTETAIAMAQPTVYI